MGMDAKEKYNLPIIVIFQNDLVVLVMVSGRDEGDGWLGKIGPEGGSQNMYSP